MRVGCAHHHLPDSLTPDFYKGVHQPFPNKGQAHEEQSDVETEEKLKHKVDFLFFAFLCFDFAVHVLYQNTFLQFPQPRSLNGYTK